MEAAHAVGAITVLDAVCSAPHYPIDVQALDTDFLLCSPYKFYGPHAGLLYGKPALLQRFGRYHNQSFAISSAAAAKLPGGRAKLDDLDGFLDGIRQPLEVQAAREGDLIRIRLVGEP